MLRSLSTLTLLLMMLAVQLTGCQPEERQEMRGSLYFGAGNYLAEMDLRDGSTSVVANLGDAEIQEMSPQLDERLLLTVFGSVNQRDVHRLVLFDLESRQTLVLLTGRHGRYLPGTKVLVYDDGTKIILAERIRGTWEKTEVLEHRYNAQVRILPISSTRFLYVEVGSTINMFDKATGESTVLDALSQYCDLDYTLWLPEREQLLCRAPQDDGTYRYLLVGVDGVVHEQLFLPVSKSFRPLAWMPDQNALVLSEQWSSRLSDRPKSAVWIYRFENDGAFRLVDDQYLGNWVIYNRW